MYLWTIRAKRSWQIYILKYSWGLVKKNSGEVTISNINIDKYAKESRKKIGIVPQELNIDPFFSPIELAISAVVPILIPTPSAIIIKYTGKVWAIAARASGDILPAKKVSTTL